MAAEETGGPAGFSPTLGPATGKGGGGSGGGTIDEITSTDGTVAITDPTGPTVNLSVGGVKTIESTDGSVTVTNPNGPVTNIEIADKTPGVVGKFTGAVTAGESATFGYMGDPGGDLAFASSDPVDPNLYQTGARTIAVLRVTAVSGNAFGVPFHVALYKNGAPTAQTVTVPAGTAAGVKFVDAGHPIAFAAGDTFDVRWDMAAAGGANQILSAVLEGPAGGASGAGIAGFSWLSTQLGRAAAMLPGGVPQIDTPWYTDLIVNPGLNNVGQGIEFSDYSTGGGSAAVVTTKPGGVYLLSTGASAGGTGEIGTPNSGAFILQNPVAGPFYVASRCLLVSGPSPSVQLGWEMVFLISATNTDAIIFLVTFLSGVATYTLSMTTAGGGSVTLSAVGVTVDFVNAHDCAVGFDGTTISAYIDGVPVPGLSTTNLIGVSALNMRAAALVANNGDAVQLQMYLDKLCVLQRSMQ